MKSTGEPTSARHGELVGRTEAHQSERNKRARIWDVIPHRLTCAGCSTSSTLDWPPCRGPRVFGKCQSLAEAAHVPSKYLTEPMRADRRHPRLGPLSMRPRIAAVRALPRADRARRFAWPARGTERFLGRRGESIAKAVDAWEHAWARPRIAVWCRLGRFADVRNSKPRTIPAQKLAGSTGVC